jgi:hypothetical protein
LLSIKKHNPVLLINQMINKILIESILFF